MGWALAGAGCRSPRGATATDSLATVEIHDHAPLEIARTLSEVFQQAGYQPVALASNKDEKMWFEKRGNAGQNLLYGDWDSAHIWYRVKIRMTLTGPDTELVSCNAFRVLNHLDAHFEEEQPVSRLRRGAYQALLDKVRNRLHAKPHPAARDQ